MAISGVNGSLGIDQYKIQLKLVEKKILPTPEEARQTHGSLKDHSWKIHIDGTQHPHGSEVFDKGLHGSHKEPGYLAGIQAGAEYFINRLQENLTLETYREIHHVACSHFKKDFKTGIICDSYEIDHFRTEASGCRLYSKEYGNFLTNTKRWITRGPRNSNEEGEIALEKQKISRVAGKPFNNDTELFSFIDEAVESSAKSTPDRLTAEVEKVWTRIGQDCFIKFVNEPYLNQIKAEYIPTTPDKVERLTRTLLNEFNENIAACQKKTYIQVVDLDNEEQLLEIKSEYQAQALRLIARLYQELEWVHPWIDGQGRTDLILLNGLLAREGLNPAILRKPYFSTFNTLEDWVTYLKAGLEAFKLERAKG